MKPVNYVGASLLLVDCLVIFDYVVIYENEPRPPTGPSAARAT